MINSITNNITNYITSYIFYIGQAVLEKTGKEVKGFSFIVMVDGMSNIEQH